MAGVLEQEDCLSAVGRLLDRYGLVLAEQTLFSASLTTVGYFPHYPVFRGVVQVSGWANDRSWDLVREHLLPAGSYVLHSTSFARGTDPATAPRGSYTLFTGLLETPQEGCGRETTVTYGSVAQGRITPNDCAAPQDTVSTVERRRDGYTFLIDGTGIVTLEVTADFPFRFAHLSNGQPMLEIPDIPAGVTRSVAVEGFGFQDFYILNEEGGVLGNYTVSFGEAPGT